jgi:hypothetical protein
MTARLALISTILAAFTFGLGYALNGLWGGAVLALAIGLLWLVGQRYGKGWVASVALIVFAGMAGVGLQLRWGTGWALFGMVAALSAWDLGHFAQRLRFAGQVEDVCGLERQHLRRLLIVDGLGLLFASIALVIRVELGFGLALALGLLAVVGLSQALRFLRRESD